jgi:hypothetical protein
MNWTLTAWFAFAGWLGFSVQAPAQLTNRVSYSLLQGSYFLDQCLICGRPDILEPLRGTFDLILLQNTPPFTKYAVQNLDFNTSPIWIDRHLSGDGVYTRFEEVALLQDMTLSMQVKDTFTNQFAFFTNDTRSVQKPFPLIEVDLTQTNGTLVQTFSMHLVAAPVTEIWFSTRSGFVSTNRFNPTNQISDGDLLSNRGRVVKQNIQLTGRLGVMPIVPNLGLDAVHITRHGEILFSIPGDVFSETLGPLHHGDLLSDHGSIVKRNQQLLAAFGPLSLVDAGLDGIQVMPDGEILFSITTNVVVNPTLTLRRGDILSDRGLVFMTQQQLLAKFHPAITGHDFGVDAFRILPWGEIWFSVEEGFTDNLLGSIQEGDLLSNLGYRVFSNQDLLAGFAPSDPAKDHGLDALFVVTDTQVSRPPPRIVKGTRSGNLFHLEWDGEGDVFQVETAPVLSGPWTPCSVIQPDLSADIARDPGSAFYRVRQW